MMKKAVNIINAGVRKVEGGCMFGTVPKADKEASIVADQKNLITLGLNCLLLHIDGKIVLIDTGAGSIAPKSLGLVPSRLRKNLSDIGVTPRSIDIVILSNLQLDHCGGATRLDRAGSTVPTLPNARYYLQSALREEACRPKEHCFTGYDDGIFLTLAESNQLELMDGDTEIVPGLHAIVPGGYAQGHQIVRFNHEDKRIAFLGDLVPTPSHLNLAVIPTCDVFWQTTLAQKREVLVKAELEGWLLVFAHGYETKAGYLQGGGRSSLRPVDL